ncbi:uncharacterized protein LOC113232406 [Hyposmocoma kahamanoa]|uniref:uncharacterized protein LOC113232406 n=1 Tax=Hyposmocoma kahamanoa TaxID=1477025 RepID=UPI000E6D8E4F|nr:uncharacterized protein LOC113232406 [Hyposmocoma kahamanoa]
MKTKYDPPTTTFPYKIKNRLNLLSIPRKQVIVDSSEGMPALSTTGVRKSALRGRISDRVNDAALPYIRRLMMLKRQYKKVFPLERLEKIDHLIEQGNITIYSKLANCVIDLKKQDTKDTKKKKSWTENDWKKHMDYIGQIAGPKRVFPPPPVERGQKVALEELLYRINQISWLPEFKLYKRISQEDWYRNPTKVSPAAMKYVITDNMKKLAAPKKEFTDM